MKTPYPLLFSLIFFVSCNKTNTDKPASDVTVYISGMAYDDRGIPAISVYWEDSVAHYLSGRSFDNANAGSVFYSDGRLYIAGREFTEDQRPVYWNNGTLVKPGSTDKSVEGWAGKIFVSGSDVYFSGTGTNSGGKYKDNHSFAKLWKNGQPIWLTSDTINSYASAIWVSGTDVHSIWYTYIDSLYSYHGWYNKNGVNVRLDAPADFNSRPFAMSLSGPDVYIFGNVFKLGGPYFYVYWKNGQMNELSLGSDINAVGGFTVSGDDIYIAAVDYSVGEGQAVYWKNGERHDLTDGALTASVSGIAVVGTDVYVSGSIDGAPLYWKNGTPHMLGGLPPYTKYDTRGIVVVKK